MKILELTLPSTNLDEQAQFFGELLGFRCNRSERNRLDVQCGANQLSFVSSDHQYYFHYCFLIPPGCLASVEHFLDERGFEPLMYRGNRIVDFANGKSVYFHDADGNLAEFIERPSLAYPIQDNFEISDVIRLNEIGIPVENPINYSTRLINDYGIVPIEEGVFRDDFVWCGDYEGVILLPRIGRNWIPMEKPAEAVQLTMTFETAKGVFEFSP